MDGGTGRGEGGRGIIAVLMTVVSAEMLHHLPPFNQVLLLPVLNVTGHLQVHAEKDFLVLNML